MGKTWKSDGPQQLELERLFREKEINPSMRPSDVQRKYAIFNGFSSSVFRNHWSVTKRKYSGGKLHL